MKNRIFSSVAVCAVMMGSVAVLPAEAVGDTHNQLTGQTLEQRKVPRGAKNVSKPRVPKRYMGSNVDIRTVKNSKDSVSYLKTINAKNKAQKSKNGAPKLVATKTVPRRGSWLLKSYGGKLYFNGKTQIKSCSQLVSLWAPSQLPAKDVFGDKMNISCVNKATMNRLGEANNVLGYSVSYMVTDPQTGDITRLVGPGEIVLRGDLPIGKVVEVYNHEAWHAYQSTWSVKKQNSYLKMLKKSSWSDYNSYMDDPLERWAWSAASCYNRFDKDIDGYQNQLPGSCRSVKKYSQNW